MASNAFNNFQNSVRKISIVIIWTIDNKKVNFDPSWVIGFRVPKQGDEASFPFPRGEEVPGCSSFWLKGSGRRRRRSFQRPDVPLLLDLSKGKLLAQVWFQSGNLTLPIDYNKRG